MNYNRLLRETPRALPIALAHYVATKKVRDQAQLKIAGRIFRHLLTPRQQGQYADELHKCRTNPRCMPDGPAAA